MAVIPGIWAVGPATMAVALATMGAGTTATTMALAAVASVVPGEVFAPLADQVSTDGASVEQVLGDGALADEASVATASVATASVVADVAAALAAAVLAGVEAAARACSVQVEPNTL